MENRRIITFLVLVWRVLLTAGSQRCNMDLCTSPDMANSSGLYELQLSSQEYSTTENGKMQISGKLLVCKINVGALHVVVQYGCNYY